MNKIKLHSTGTRLLALLLVLMMAISLLPLTIFAADKDSSDEDDFYRIIMLDCGRKYFSADWIKALIVEASAAGYNQLQLSFGNDGLRFLLDDMSITVDGTTYPHETVVSKVEAGNAAQNSSGDSRWLSQSEMDGIIEFAAAYGIEIVPMLNLPGHANAILDIFDDAYNASGSNNTLDVANNETAREIGKTILQKYVNYFAKNGCKYFNFGADEYANDASGTFSFSRLNSTQYATFVNFVNDMATIIRNVGMTPRCFNDGLYYNGQSANFDTGIQCCYWSSGWSSYPVASASAISAKGHNMINTNGDYYYVLGKDDKFDSGYSEASGFSNTAFMGSTISSPAGSMFCIWCDYPNAETETEVAQKIRMPLRAMAARMQDSSIDDLSTDVVSGGFNADGTINAGTTLTDEETGVTVSFPSAVTDMTVTKATVNAITVDYVAYDVNGTGYVSGSEATITIPLSDELKALPESSLRGFHLNSDGTYTEIEGTKNDDGTFTFKTSFSTVGVKVADIANGEVNIEVGETETIDLEDGAEKTNDPNSYIATAEVKTSTATTASVNQNVTSITSGSKYLILPYTPNGKVVTSNTSNGYNGDWPNASGLLIQSVTINDNNVDNLKQYAWTITEKDNGQYTVQNSAGKYLNIVGNESLTLSETEVALNIGWSNEKVYFKNDNDCYLNNFGGGSTFASGYTEPLGNGDRWTLYEITEESTGGTTLTITGTGEGKTSVVVGGTTYTITVTAPTVTGSFILSHSGTMNLPTDAQDSKITSGSNIIALSGNTITAGTTDGTATVTFVTKNDGSKITAYYTYTVQVVTEDLSSVADFPLEYWITNGKVTADGSNSYSLTAEAAYGQNGISVTSIAPENGTHGKKAVEYWRCVLLDKSTNEQTDENGVDQTWNGPSFSKIRYFNGLWQVYTEDNKWVNVNSNNYQFVAYYLYEIEINNASTGTSELLVNTADWGSYVDNNYSAGFEYYDDNNKVSISFQIVYEDGTTNPGSTTLENLQPKTLTFATASNTRGIGTVLLTAQEGYEIYKVTSEYGDLNYTNHGSTFTLSSFNWIGTETTVWGDDSELSNSVTLHEANGSTSTTSSLVWRISENQDAILIRIYVKAVATQDSLAVEYYDLSNNLCFYNYNIKVADDTSFDTGFGISDNVLVNNTVKNYYGVVQTVQSDLSEMPQIDAKYRNTVYTLTTAERTDDGKTVRLYYKFNNQVSFVADFGLPLSISLQDISVNLNSGNITSCEFVGQHYGTLEYTNATIIYTPNSILKQTENITVNFTGKITYNDEDGNTVTKNDTVGFIVNIIPASTVYYEDSFVTTKNGAGSAAGAEWTIVYDNDDESNAKNLNQELEALGKKTNNYGYDNAYDNGTQFSMGSAKKVTVNKTMSQNWNSSTSAWPTATFTFKGTGFDLISLTNNDSGLISYKVKDEKGNVVDSKFVNNYYGYSYNEETSEWVVDTVSTDTLYQIPVVKVDGLNYGTYTVTITVSYGSYFDNNNDDTYSFWLDGIRVYNTLGKDTDTYKDDGEAYPQFIELRNALANTTEDKYQAVFIDGKTEATLTEYTNYGPNHEVYLAPGQSVAFKLSDDNLDKIASVQLGAKAVNGAVTYKINNGDYISLATSTDLYYDITTVAKDDIVTVTNIGESGILSLTTVKVTFNSAATVELSMTKQEVETAVYAVRAMFAMPVEPENFEPETFKAVFSPVVVKEGKTATLTVTASEEVEAITVDGDVVDTYKTRTVTTGWGSNRTTVTYHVFTYTVTASETADYSIVAVNSDGAVSEPLTATLTVWEGFGNWFKDIIGRFF